jgi:hypothetical protein
MSRDPDHERRADLVERNPDGSLTSETLKRAMKAFRRRLKLTRTDDESRLGRNPLTSGNRSSIVGIKPPEQYPAEVWDDLVARGRLRKLGPGQYEAVDP